jgi:hypothetical protein
MINMQMAGFVLLAVGLGTFAMALRTKDDINRIAVMVAGAIFRCLGICASPFTIPITD